MQEQITVLWDALSEEKKKKKRQRERNQGHSQEEGGNDRLFSLIHQSMFYPKDLFILNLLQREC